MRTLFSVLFFVATLSSFAQSSQYVKGKILFDNGDYEAAIEVLEVVMQSPSKLKAKEVPEGWYHLGKAKAILYSNAMSLQDGPLLRKYEGYDIEAYGCFKNVLSTNPRGGRDEATIDDIKSIYYVIFNSGNTYYLLGEEEKALKYYSAAEEIATKYEVKGDYQVYSLRGQTYLAVEDSSSAYDDFKKAIERYDADTPEIPDANIGYAYYSMAIIERYVNNDLNRALYLTQTGTEFLQKEEQRLMSLLNDSSADQRVLAAQSDQFANILDALNRFELDIYRNYPEKYDEAVAKFQKVLKENPDDAHLYIVYANLIEYNEPEAALDAYNKALEIDPNNVTALFNAGANRVNKGVEFALKANEETDFKKASAWEEKVDEQFNLALPYLTKAHELDPENIYVIEALLQVTIQLDMMDEYKFYKDKQKALRGY